MNKTVGGTTTDNLCGEHKSTPLIVIAKSTSPPSRGGDLHCKVVELGSSAGSLLTPNLHQYGPGLDRAAVFTSMRVPPRLEIVVVLMETLAKMGRYSNCA
jgi:hypothetical protein